MDKKVIGFPHPPQKHGGPGSFQSRLELCLKNLGWSIVYPEDNVLPDVILVVGGTKKHKWLKICKKAGVRIVHRLDGMNWLHRVKKMPLKQKLLAEVRNRMTAKIRRKWADHIIYQSQFVKEWWEKVEGPTKVEHSIIPNAVDLSVFKPKESSKPAKLICVEGTIDYSPFALDTLEFLAGAFPQLEVEIYGNIEDKSLMDKFPVLNFKGSISRDKIHEVYNNGIYISLDVNAACPNTVIEALASGIPVVGYDTGALKELISENGGGAVSFGSDPWKLQNPDLNNLKLGIEHILENFEEYCVNARKLAEDKYSIDLLTEKYIKVLSR